MAKVSSARVPRTDPLRSDLLKEEIAVAKVGDLKVYVLPKKGFRRKNAELFVHYGSNDNAFAPPGGDRVDVPPGIAHFLEHKMFEKEWGDAFSQFGRIGASGNAYTSGNYTSYLFWTLNNWQKALEILFEVVFCPYFTDESVEKEQSIIGQEIRMYNDNPSSRLVRETLEALYESHPVRLDIAGTEESIGHISKDLLYLCHESFYRPENMALFVAGDLDAGEVLDLAGKLVGRVKTGGKGIPTRIRPDEPPSVGKDREVSLPVPVPLMQIAWKDRPAGDDGEALVRNELAASLMLDIMFGKSSAFFTKVYEDGLVDDMSASYEAWPDYALSYITAQTSRPEELAHRVQEQTDVSRRSGVGDADFVRVKKAMLGRYVMLFDSPDIVGEMQAHLDDVGQDVFSYGRILESLRAEDVNDRLEMMAADRSVRVIVRDKSQRGR